MADTFFGFNTAITGSLDDELPDEPGQGLEDDDEEEYDALNDETFGADALGGDWEEDHEKLAEIAEQSRIHHNSFNNDSHVDSDDHADLDLEASISQLVLDDYDDPDFENGDNTKPESNTSRHFPSSQSGIDLIDSSSYSSSAPSGYSVWGVTKQDSQSVKSNTQSILPGVKKVCTVEELERDLLSKRNAAAQAANLNKSSSALLSEDGEKNLSNSGSSRCTGFPVAGLGIGRGQALPAHLTHQDPVALRNTQNAVGSIVCGSGVAQFSAPLTGPAPQPILGMGRGLAPNAAFGQVVMPSRLLGNHPPPLPIPDFRQLQQQNHRLMGSAPNLLRFIPPHLIIQSQQALRDGNKSIGHQNFPPENGMLRTLHHNNMGYRPAFQNPLLDHHRMPMPGQFAIRPERMMSPHYMNNRNPSGNFNQHHGHRGNYNSHHNYNNYRHHQQHNMENGSGDYDDYAGLMTNREKQWLLNIQLIQLNSSQPYVDDYYYTIFAARKPKKEIESKQGGDIHHRERRDSHRDREQRSDQQGSSKVYTPAQFENSLGKLQVGSVTAPRKIIDMDVVSHEGLDSTMQSVQRDSRKAKQSLLEIESLYTILLQLEDLASPVPEVRDAVTEDRADLLHKIISSLIVEDRLINFMYIHKGKLLLLRVLPHLLAENEADSHLVHIWSSIFRGLVSIGKRDQSSEESLLPRFYTHFRAWLIQSKFPAILEVAQSMVSGSRDSSRTASPFSPVVPTKNVLVYALGNKFGVSSLAAMMKRVETLYSVLEDKQLSDWSSFITNLVEAVSLVKSPNSLSTPIEPMDATVLNRHLGRCSNLSIVKYAVLEQVLTGFQETEKEKDETKINT